MMTGDNLYKELISMGEHLNRLTEQQIMSIPFGGIEETMRRSHKAVTRVSPDEMDGHPRDDEKIIELRQRLAYIWHEKTTGSYPKLELLTIIKPNTFQKWANGTRTPSRLELMKFAVGLSINIDQASELFALLGHALDPEHNRLDFIAACALRDGDDIDAFGRDAQKYCAVKIY